MNTTEYNKQNLTVDKTLKDTCQELCAKFVQQIGQAKKNLVAEFRDAFATQEQLLQLAIVEADALAWQTDYPHLLFPALATEKIERAAHWQARQGFLLRNTSPYALAA
jgi:tRNA nucleotidyltransferase/poly(A) polymerase